MSRPQSPSAHRPPITGCIGVRIKINKYMCLNFFLKKWAQGGQGGKSIRAYCVGCPQSSYSKFTLEKIYYPGHLNEPSTLRPVLLHPFLLYPIHCANNQVWGSHVRFFNPPHPTGPLACANRRARARRAPSARFQTVGFSLFGKVFYPPLSIFRKL